ncbi:MAG: hypothetical protein H7196_03460, partial [candidate division SR1 bacterium]|nr:hypothetical protein [candidate division SR1 bacterium]
VSSCFEVVAGGLVGFFGGLVSTSSYFGSFVPINMGLSRQAYIATSAAVDFIGNILDYLFIFLMDL